MFEWVKSLHTHLAPSGAMGQLVSPDKYQPLHPGYIVSVMVRRRFGWDADDEREKLALEILGIGNSPLLFLS